VGRIETKRAAVVAGSRSTGRAVVSTPC